MSSAQELLLEEEHQLALTRSLYQEDIFGIKENPDDFITLKSQRNSPHYLDLRQGITDKYFRTEISLSMYELALERVRLLGHNALESVYDYVVGTPEAFTSYAPRIADEAGIGLLQPRVATEKTRGNKSPIIGRWAIDNHVASFDDVITDGESKIDTIKLLDREGLKVVDYFVVVDREEGGSQQVLEATGVKITPALAVSRMAIMLFAESEISRTQFDNVHEYLEQYGDERAKVAMREAA